MHTHNRLAALLPLLALSTALHAQVSINFDNAAYTITPSIHGVDDPDIPGSVTWTGSATSPTVTTYAGSQALRLNPTNPNGTVVASSAYLASLPSPNVVFNGTAANGNNLVYLSFDYALESSQFSYYGTYIRLGGSGFNNTTPAWAAIRMSGTTVQLVHQNAEGSANTTVALPDVTYSALANAGEYVRVNLVIDTETNLYKSLTLSGSKSSVDLTSFVSTLKLPFHNGATDPTTSRLTFTSSDATITDTIPHIVHLDNVYIGNAAPAAIPEGAACAALAGAGGLAFTVSRRPRR